MTATQIEISCVICGDESGSALCEICSLDSGIRDPQRWAEAQIPWLKLALDERMEAHHRDFVMTREITKRIRAGLTNAQLAALPNWAKTMVKNSGERCRAILNLTQRPVTVKEMHAALQQPPHRVSIKTIYRDVQRLLDAGALVPVGATQYQAKNQAHHD